MVGAALRSPSARRRAAFSLSAAPSPPPLPLRRSRKFWGSRNFSGSGRFWGSCRTRDSLLPVTAPRALVVGGSSDIGTAIAADLADLGHDLVLWGRDRGRLAAAAATSGGASANVVDVTDGEAMTRALDGVLAEGGLDVVVWAAGLFDWSPAQEADPGRWRQVLDVNITAAAVLTSLVLPTLVARAPSALVYIGSGAARRAYPGNAAYVASKHGLAGLAHAVFLDVRDYGVKVSLVSPGMVAAGASLLSPAGRERPGQLLTPDDVAAAVRFVVTFPTSGCPVEIDLQPQRST